MTTTTAPITSGIAFRAELIGPIRSGAKTQTRRVIRPQPFRVGDPSGRWAWRHRRGDFFWRDGLDPMEACEGIGRTFHHGPAGSRHYIKEAIVRDDEDRWVYRSDDALVRPHGAEGFRGMERWLLTWRHGKRTPYRSSRYMPRWAARTFIVITDLRLEKLLDITEEDAIAEGMSAGGLLHLISTAVGDWSPLAHHWTYGLKHGGDLDFCREHCIAHLTKELGTTEIDDFLDGGFSTENDSAPYCETCGKLLDFTFTDYGARDELDAIEERGIGESEEDLYRCLKMLYGGIGDPQYFPDTVGAVARIQFRHVWNRIHGAEGLGWEANPWIQVYGFRRIEP